MRGPSGAAGDFTYVESANLLALNGIGMGLMAAPNSAAIMNALPANQRGAASGVRATGMNAGVALSMDGFTLMAVKLSSRLPSSLYHGLTSVGGGVNRRPGVAPVPRRDPVRGISRRQSDQGSRR